MTFAAAGIVVFLTLLNLRGVKESVLLWVPVFFLFVVSYAVRASLMALSRTPVNCPVSSHGVASDVQTDYTQIGLWGLIVVILRAYSLGAGTYTGIEAVSNGVSALREPRVQTGKRTMVYMGTSLALVVGGLMLAYLLFQVEPVDGKTLNAVLFEQMTSSWPPILAQGFRHCGARFVGRPAVHRGANRISGRPARAGQHGGGPLDAHALCLAQRPARDPERRAADGRGGAGGGAVHPAAVSILVVLYSINVFITFTLSQLGMVRHWWLERAREPAWKRKLFINGFGLLLDVAAGVGPGDHHAVGGNPNHQIRHRRRLNRPSCQTEKQRPRRQHDGDTVGAVARGDRAAIINPVGCRQISVGLEDEVACVGPGNNHRITDNLNRRIWHRRWLNRPPPNGRTAVAGGSTMVTLLVPLLVVTGPRNRTQWVVVKSPLVWRMKLPVLGQETITVLPIT